MQHKLPAVTSREQQQQLQQYCRDIVRQWSLNWFGRELEASGFSMNQQLFCALPDKEGCVATEQGVALFYQQKAMFNAVFGLAIAGQHNAKELADLQLIQQFSAHILHDLAGRFSTGHTLPEHASGQTQWQLEMTLTLEHQPIVVRLSAARVKSVLTQSQSENVNAAAALVPHLQALHAEQIDITPNISSVEIPLKQLLNLQVGSVIKLSQPIAKPIPLSSNGKVITMAGYLVNQHGNKALYLTGNTHEQH